MEDTSLGISGYDVVERIGDALSYVVTWEDVEGLPPLPVNLRISLGPATAARIVRPVEAYEGACPPGDAPKLGVIRSFQLEVGEDLSASGSAWTSAADPGFREVHLGATDVEISDEAIAAGTAWLASQVSGVESVHDFEIAGLFDLATPEMSVSAYWDGDSRGSALLWRSSALTPSPSP